MCLGEVLILAYEYDYSIPEILHLVLLQTVADYFSFTNVGQCISTLRICTEEEINTSTFCFFAKKQIIKFRSRSSQRLTRPIRYFSNT